MHSSTKIFRTGSPYIRAAKSFLSPRESSALFFEKRIPPALFRSPDKTWALSTAGNLIPETFPDFFRQRRTSLGLASNALFGTGMPYFSKSRLPSNSYSLIREIIADFYARDNAVKKID